MEYRPSGVNYADMPCEPSREQSSAERLDVATCAVVDAFDELERLLSRIGSGAKLTGSCAQTEAPRPVPTLAGALNRVPDDLRKQAERGRSLVKQIADALGV